MNNHISIAYCIPALYYPSGMERVLTQKANYFAERGYEVHIILTDGEGESPYYHLDSRIKLHQLAIDFEEPYHYGLLKRIWLYQKKMHILEKKLNECLCNIHPDITISLLRRDINVINKMKDGSIKIGEIHFDRLHYRQFNSRYLPKFLCKMVSLYWSKSLIAELGKLARFVVLTHEDASNWPELKNLAVIPNPISLFPENRATCHKNQVMACGRYVEQKGFDRLIDAWAIVSKQHKDWILRIYGDGHLREILEQQVNELGLESQCILEHSVKDIYGCYLNSSIFVLSSRFEGFGLVLAEAMASGVPVISFACPCGPKDIITDGVDGLLAKDGDIQDLANKIIILIENVNKRIKMGNQARLSSQRYHINQIGPQWESLFEELLSGLNKKANHDFNDA